MMTKNSKTKYHPDIDRYIEMIETGEVRAGKEQLALIEFIKNKLDEPNVVIKEDIINEGFENIDRHFDFDLFEWERFIMCFVMGVYYDDGTLVFNEFLVMLGRGAGKTGFMSVIEWWLATKQDIKAYHVDIVATSEDQSKESFKDIWDILEDNKKKYKKHFRWTREQIVYKKTKSMIRYRTNNAKTKDGGRQGAVIFDEIHAYPNEDSVKVFISGLGKKPNPRRFYFTTDGDLRGGFLDNLKDEAQFILAGERPNRRTFPFICKLDDAEEVHDKDNWEKANPSLRYMPSLRMEMELEYDKFEDRAQSRLEFMTKRMNLPSTDSWLDVTSWENILETSQDVPDLTGRSCVGAIDYAETTDFASVGLLFKVDDKYYLKQHTFINRKALIGRSYNVPIDVAVDAGLVTIIDDPTIKPETIAGWFVAQAPYYQIKAIASDDYRLSYLRTAFTEAGIGDLLQRARKGLKTHTELEPVVEDLFSYHNIVFCDDDFMMRWYTNNVYKHRDEKLNIEYRKREPKLRKTDGFFMLLHALQYRNLLDEQQISYDFGLKTYTY